MSTDRQMALFIMLGQTAMRTVRSLREVAPPESVLLSPSFDVAPLMPDAVKSALRAAEAYKLFFIFESYLREFVVDVLSKDPSVNWWDRLSKPIQDEVKKLEETEEAKAWMAVGSRDKSALLTFPQLLAAIDENWKSAFEEVVRDKTLLQSARAISHLRNTICHMSEIPEEEFDRVRQTMRDWFRMVAP